jgi:hypothetical protein
MVEQRAKLEGKSIILILLPRPASGAARPKPASGMESKPAARQP